MSSKSISPNHREILSARSTITGNQEYLTSTGGVLNINGSIGGSPIPITGATTGVGVAILDTSGNQISSFGGGTQYTDGGVPPTHPIGSTIEWSDGSNWQTVSTAKPLPVTASFSPSGTQDVNLKQVGGVTTAVGNGVTGTGSQRVTIASDNTAFSVNATLSAETTKVIGTVNQGTSPWVVSGTVTANAGTNLNTSTLALESGGNLSSIKTDVDNLNLAIGSTTSGQKGNLILGATTTAAPTYTTAQSNPLSLTTGGLLRVDGSGVTQPVSLTSTTITGTVAVTQSGTWTNTVTQATAANLNATVVGTGTFAVQAAQSGTWNITNISGTISLPTGASTSALQTTGNTSLSTIATNTTGLTIAQGSTTSGQTGQLTQGAVTTAAPTYTTAQTSPLSLDTSGNLRTTTTLGASSNVIGHVITDTGSTTAVTGTVTVSGTVTANAGTNLNTSLLALESGGNLASIKTDVDNLNLAQASTTSGQKGNLILGAVTTAAPAYTTAQSNPLSLTTGGLLRVDGSGVTQPVSLTSTTITGTVAVTQSTSPWVVSNGGTFAVQATLAAETTKVIGTVNQGTSPWIVSGSGTAGSAATGVVSIQGIASMTPVQVSQATPANLNATVVGTGTFSVQTTSDTPGTGATNLGKAEDAGHTTGDTGVMALGVRNDTLAATTNATADYTQVTTDQAGIVITAGAPRALKGRQVTTLTSSTAETTIITSIASTFLDLYGLILTNTSAAVTKVSIRDATAGGTISVFEVPPTDTRGFMLPLDSAIPQAAVTNNWTAQCGTSVASLEVTALYVKRV